MSLITAAEAETHPRIGLSPDLTMVQRLRLWATRRPVVASLLGGFVGVHIASMFGFWLGGFGLRRLDWNTANGFVYWPKGDALSQFLIGWGMHYVDGIFFGLLFALAIHPALPWANTVRGNLLKGLAFGTGMSFIALLILTPLVYAPARGLEAGFFSMNFGFPYVISVFVFHWLYGAHLALVYNPLSKEEARALTA